MFHSYVKSPHGMNSVLYSFCSSSRHNRDVVPQLGGQHFDCLPATVDVCQLGLQHVLGLRWHQLSLPLLRHVFARDQGAAEHQDWAKRLEGSKTLFAHFIPSPVHIQDPSPLLPPCFQGGVNVPNRIKGGWDFHRFGILLPMSTGD